MRAEGYHGWRPTNERESPPGLYAPGVERRLEQLYSARRAALEAEAAVLDADREEDLVPILSEALDAARAHPTRHEASFRLQVLADLLSRVAHPGAVTLLLDILNDPDDSVRAAAAAATSAAARSRYEQVVQAVRDSLETGFEGPALLELPSLLLDGAGPDDPVAFDLIVQLLESDDPDVAAEAACVLAELGVAGVRELLESLQDDDRPLSDAVDGPATVGALARDLLASMDAPSRGQA